MITTKPRLLSNNSSYPLHGYCRSKIGIVLSLSLFMAAPCLWSASTYNPDLDDNQEVITLEEFKVSGSVLNDSYIATESTAGTRFTEKIIDLPYTVEVLTEDFINDFQLYSDDDLMSFISGATANTGAGDDGLRVRGFTTRKTRDGFRYAMPGSPSNTKAKEFIKGPQSILYGRTEPGGILNEVTRRPMQKPQYTFTGVYGTDKFRRVSLTGTGPIIANKLFYYAYVDYMGSRDYNFWGTTGGGSSGLEDDVMNDSIYAGLSILYKIQKYSSLYVTFEYQPVESVQGSGLIVAYDELSTTASANRTHKGIRGWTGIGKFNAYYAPNAFRDVDFYGLNILWEHRINNNWSARASIQTYTKNTDKLRWDGGRSYFMQDDWFSQRAAYKQDQQDDVISLQSELVGNFRTKDMSHRVMFAVDGSYQDQDDTEWEYNNTATAPAKLRLYHYNPNYWDPIVEEDVTHIQSDTNLKVKSFGALASYRLTTLKGRLSFMASGRYDYYEDSVDDIFSSAHKTADGYDKPSEIVTGKNNKSGSKFTYSLGANYKLIGERLLAFISTSTGYSPKSTIDHGTRALVPPQESSSVEAGLKGTSQDNFFGYTLSIYDMTLRNVATTNEDYTGNIHAGEGSVPEYSISGKQVAKGFEGNFFLKPTPELTLMGSFGYINSKVKEAQDNDVTYKVGAPAALISKWNFSLSARYQPITTGWLKGTTFGLSATFRTYYTAYQETDAYYEVTRPSLLMVRAFIKYAWRTGKYSHTVTLNGNNILNKEYYSRSGRQMLGAEARLTYALKF